MYIGDEPTPDEMDQIETSGTIDDDKLDFGDDLDQADADNAGDGEEGKSAVVSDEAEKVEDDAAAGAEGTGAGDGDGNGADDGTGKEKTGPRIPYTRFKAVVDRANDATKRAEALEREIARLKGGTPEASPVAKLTDKLDALYEKVEEARGVGKTQEAAKLQREIDQINRAIVSHEASVNAKESTLIEVRQREYDTAVAMIEEKFPELNPDTEHYDETIAGEVSELMDAFVAKGMSEAAALKKAMIYVFQDEETLKNGTAHLYATPKAVEKVAEKVADKKAEVTKDRKNVAARVSQAQRTPPRVDTTGRSNTSEVAIDPSKLSDAEWDKLPESTKARMRGDHL